MGDWPLRPGRAWGPEAASAAGGCAARDPLADPFRGELEAGGAREPPRELKTVAVPHGPGALASSRLWLRLPRSYCLATAGGNGVADYGDAARCGQALRRACPGRRSRQPELNWRASREERGSGFHARSRAGSSAPDRPTLRYRSRRIFPAWRKPIEVSGGFRRLRRELDNASWRAWRGVHALDFKT